MVMKGKVGEYYKKTGEGGVQMEAYYIGVDVGGTKTAYGLFDEKRRLLKQWKAPSDPSLSPEAFFDGICGRIKGIREDRGITPGGLAGIGVCLPSCIRHPEGYVQKTSNLSNLRDFPAKSYLQEKFGAIPIALGNDAQAAALAEFRHGAGRGFRHMVYCPVSTGIASGIIIDGKLFRGSYGWAGESGHMLASLSAGLSCGCGNRGCFESYCGGRGIVRHIQEQIRAGTATLMTGLAGNPAHITAAHLLTAYDQGDALAAQAVEQMAQYMGMWLYNLYVVLNINCYVFGGGLLHFGNRLFGKVRRVFRQYQNDGMPVYFLEALLGQTACLAGAVELLAE